MKKIKLTLVLLIAIGYVTCAQTTDSFVSNCAMNTGANAKYLKDFRIQLGKSTVQGELRFKANISLWKNTKYRFTMCNSEDSKGQLILNIRDDANKVVLSSVDKKTGKTFPWVDYVCNKSGIYQLNYDFTNGQPGSGVGVVSMVR